MSITPTPGRSRIRLFLPVFLAVGSAVCAAVLLRPMLPGQERIATPYLDIKVQGGKELVKQTAAEAAAKSASCVNCHQQTCDPHFKETLHLGCCDCHGGDPTNPAKEQAHVAPRFPDAWRTSANPVRSYTLLNQEHPAFVRFVNPGDLRCADISCGTSGCHPKEVLQNRKGMMTHGAMLWEAAAYNNGTVPVKFAAFGESYSSQGVPQRLQTYPPPTDDELKHRGVVAAMDPLPRFEISQPANVFRIFERGGRFNTEVGIPEPDEDPGKPRTRLSTRGLGTLNRTDPGVITLLKTRLLDPTLNFMGTNDHPGDYRSSGCTSCHVIYANDRSRTNSGPYAVYGNRGLSFSSDPTIPRNESGHPIAHRFAPGNAIPTSQCMICHVHPGTTVMNSYTGFQWWDEETDGNLMYPKKGKHLTEEEIVNAQMSNPDEASQRGLWSDPEFLTRVSELNPQAKHTQFADFHSHGWVFRAVFKHDRQGNLLDKGGNKLPNVGPHELMAAMDPETRLQPGVPVHLLDIHTEKGMHCIDCHFVQDVHGNGRLQEEVRAGIEIQCIDCHGTATKRATLKTTGPASYTSGEGGRDLEAFRTPSGKRRFERRGDKIFQNGMVEDKSWEVVQTIDTITPGSDHYNAKSAIAKTVRFEGSSGEMVWGDVPAGGKGVAHENSNMTCIACHSSWNPTCYGCHLPQKANKKMPNLHNEGDVTKNLVSYNFQTLRDEVFMLARDGDVTGNRIGPSRSSCAIHVGSYNGLREHIYQQQSTISAEGLSGIAFSTNVPHTVRGKGVGETKQCTDCHISSANDNNALTAQLMMQGTGYLNFMGRICWVAAGEHGLFGVPVTEREEPQTVLGSTLHELAFPEEYHEHVEHGGKLEHAQEHVGRDIGEQMMHPFRKADVRQVQLHGEYLFAACGCDGLKVFDVAFVEDKAFSERITTAPVSPLGQQFYVKTANAEYVGFPATMTMELTRTHTESNKEPKIPPMYGYAYICDKVEGVILVNTSTTTNGNPTDNFLGRALTFNPDGKLHGARHITFVGEIAYVCCDAGLAVISFADPKKPKLLEICDEHVTHEPKTTAAQFRYLFVCEEGGLAVLDITCPEKPRRVAEVPLGEAHNVYVARTYAYVAAGHEGLVIVDVENPEHPKIEQKFTADGCLRDVLDVKLGITYVSEFAYVADGKGGLRVIQLTSADQSTNYGFSPKPEPKLIATFKVPKGGEVLSVTRALDRDRAVDEAGNQIAVFGRIGARPFNFAEQRKLYLRGGMMWQVSDDPADPRYVHHPYKQDALPPPAPPTKPTAAHRRRRRRVV